MHTNDDTPPCGNWPPLSPEHEGGGHRHVALPATVLAAGPELLSAVPLPACRDRLRWEIGAGCSSGGECNNSYGGGSPTAGSSPASGRRYGVTGFQEGGVRCHKRPDASYCPPAGFLEPDFGPAGQLFSSSGDLQGINKLMVQRNYYCCNNNGVRRRVGWWWSESSTPLTTESNTIIEGMSREACRRYTPAEKRQRIDRYRFKRNLRNFNKKIKYECRKTLADNRPRIRGRFAARNNENNDESSSCSDDFLITTTPSSSSSITTTHHHHHHKSDGHHQWPGNNHIRDDDDYDYDCDYGDGNPTMDVDGTCWFNNLQLIDTFTHFQQI